MLDTAINLVISVLVILLRRTRLKKKKNYTPVELGFGPKSFCLQKSVLTLKRKFCINAKW